jgi:hypothetical protein
LHLNSALFLIYYTIYSKFLWDSSENFANKFNLDLCWRELERQMEFENIAVGAGHLHPAVGEVISQ